MIHKLHNLHIIRRNDWRERGSKALNRHFCTATGSGNAAEMAHLQRMAPVYPPRAYWGAVAADVKEQGAENAKALQVLSGKRLEACKYD